jgi:hypothetical protein
MDCFAVVRRAEERLDPLRSKRLQLSAGRSGDEHSVFTAPNRNKHLPEARLDTTREHGDPCSGRGCGDDERAHNEQYAEYSEAMRHKEALLVRPREPRLQNLITMDCQFILIARLAPKGNSVD